MGLFKGIKFYLLYGPGLLRVCMYRVCLLVLECDLLAGYMYMQNVGSMNRQKGHYFCFAASGGEKCRYIFR